MSKLFYGEEYRRSYFIGCSLGGRQGIDAADRYPEDYDGIIAGSPATDLNNMYAWRASFLGLSGTNTSAIFIDAAKWAVIHQEVLKQCDTIDGVKDGIIEDSSLCVFRPEALLCADDRDMTSCLTPAQVDIVSKIYSPYYGTHGNLIYPGFAPGNELLASTGLYSGTPFATSLNWYRYVLLNESTWNQSSFNVYYAELSDKINPSNVRTYPTTLAPFQKTGGKIISFHGGQDQQITPYEGTRFYNHLASGMSASSSDLDEFFRFFRISGMYHCSNGPGAWSFGQSGGFPYYEPQITPFRPDVNVLAAIVNWIENGTAPDTITGTKYVNDTISEGIAFQRKHCRYPYRNTYIGGDASDPSSWECNYT